ncbi:MAG TPA: hypothetical protein VIK18_21910 [Pirellulales bacterium]
MPEEFSLPSSLKQARWKVKIQEKERLEHPHVSILRKTDKWRINLRTKEFMDDVPDPKDVPDELLSHIFKDKNWKHICAKWNAKYPDNLVESED